MLEVKDLTMAYGPIEAVRKASFSVKAVSVVTLIGANGAGKTTILNALSGVAPVINCRIVLAGMTVRENLELGA